MRLSTSWILSPSPYACRQVGQDSVDWRTPSSDRQRPERHLGSLGQENFTIGVVEQQQHAISAGGFMKWACWEATRSWEPRLHANSQAPCPECRPSCRNDGCRKPRDAGTASAPVQLIGRHSMMGLMGIVVWHARNPVMLQAAAMSCIAEADV